MLKIDAVALNTSIESELTQVKKAQDLYVRNRDRGVLARVDSATTLVGYAAVCKVKLSIIHKF